MKINILSAINGSGNSDDREENKKAFHGWGMI
jgi:hypothetical protein